MPAVCRGNEKATRDRNASTAFNPAGNDFFPGICFVTIRLFHCSDVDEFCCLQPPNAATLKPGFRFRPQLVPVTSQEIDVNSTTSYRPEAPTTAVVTQVTGMIHTAGENALARRFD
jgi:hypothetical protein